MALLMVLACAFGLARPASADGSLDVRGWLERPGVKLLAVEFYATWCKPCMAAVPKWKTLHEKYRKLGLRLVVVATQDPKGGCSNPGWSPDEIVCDDDGTLAERFGATTLPAAFLWGWQGDLLVSKGHVEDVDIAIKAWMRESPRVDVAADEVVAGAGVTKSGLLAMVRAEVQRDDKLLIVATDAERKQLDAMRARSFEAKYDETLQCEVGKDLSANSLLKASIVSTGTRPRLHLTLLSAERGCLVANAVEDWDKAKASVVVAAAVRQLMQKIKRPTELPSARSNGNAVARPADRALGEAPPDWQPDTKGEQALVTFSSKPVGAVVEVDGKLACQDTSAGCTKALVVGPHTVTMQAERYEKRSARVDIKKGSRVEWTLAPNFGLLDVTSAPAGIDVKVNGLAVGKTPLNGHELDPGTYDVLVGNACVYETGKQVTIAPGETKTVDATPKPREGAIDVTAEDDKGNAVEAEVVIDGARVGKAPGVFRLSVCSKKLELKHVVGAYEQALQVEERRTLTVRGRLSLRPETRAVVFGYLSVAVVPAKVGSPGTELEFAL